MKYLSLLLLFFSLNTFAQKQEPFRIDSLPKQGILLDKNWKWHAGDNPDFAKADFDDSKWDTINPTLHFDKLPQVIEAEISWFRLSFSVDSSLLNKPILMDFTPTGAFEIYLNGKLVHTIGKVSKDSKFEETLVADFDSHTFVLTQTGTNNLAFRYSFTKSNFYFQSQSPFSLSLRSPKGFTANVRKNTFLQTFQISFIVGFLFIMAILHLCFYYFYPPQKANLIFSLALFGWVISLYVFDLRLILPPTLSMLSVLVIVNAIGGAIYLILIVAAVYQYTGQRFTLLFWGLVSLFFVDFIMIWWFRYDIDDNDYFFSFNMFLSFSIYVYVSYKAMKASIKSAKFLFYGGFFLLVLLIASITQIYLNYFFSLDFLNIMYVILFQITIPVSLSFALARDFAQTSFSLQRNLDEVKQLSEEKQQILATQNETLEKQVEARTAELKASQNQLIQKEKLASLGELTAGIAHEIQNPLNFVNNFSELSVELIEELKSPLTPDGGIREGEKMDMELIEDVVQNLEKINLHGKRAAGIVSSMLEHSRSSTGERVMTDINKLADEYLRLSYHGMRAKYKSFNADYELIADENLPLINCVPQDIGRVLLNLINNAFYACTERSRSAVVSTSLNDCSPKVIVKTEHTANQLTIKVIDNGTGMSKEVQEKIFQPFFTTKPTGEGTGLGLSLTYDIVTKGHGGTIEVESIEGEGTTFTVKLPIA